MLENDDTLKNSTQLRIMKLMDELNVSEHQYSRISQTRTNAQADQLAKIRQQMTRTFESLNEKIETATSILSEVEKQKRDIADFKRKLRLISNFQEKIDDLTRNAKQFFESSERDLEEQQKCSTAKIMEVKLRTIESSQVIKHQLEFYEKEVMPRQIQKIQRRYLKNKEKSLPQIQNKLKALRRCLEEEPKKNKAEVKKMKECILGAFEKIQESVYKEEQNINKSFQVHFQTLEKLIGSVANKM